MIRLIFVRRCRWEQINFTPTSGSLLHRHCHYSYFPTYRKAHITYTFITFTIIFQSPPLLCYPVGRCLFRRRVSVKRSNWNRSRCARHLSFPVKLFSLYAIRPNPPVGVLNFTDCQQKHSFILKRVIFNVRVFWRGSSEMGWSPFKYAVSVVGFNYS